MLMNNDYVLAKISSEISTWGVRDFAKLWDPRFVLEVCPFSYSVLSEISLRVII